MHLPFVIPRLQIRSERKIGLITGGGKTAASVAHDADGDDPDTMLVVSQILNALRPRPTLCPASLYRHSQNPTIPRCPVHFPISTPITAVAALSF